MADTKKTKNFGLQSMTGYGASSLSSDVISVNVEIKTLNGRFLDINLKLPRAYSSIEQAIKKTVEARLSRGRVEIQIFRVSDGSSSSSILLNQALLQKYLQLYKQAFESAKVPFELNASQILDILSKKDVIESGDEELTESEETLVFSAVNQAVEKLVLSRSKEGLALEKDLLERISALEENLAKIKSLAADNNLQQKAKVAARISKLVELADLDEGRLEMEVAILADKLDITEELVRMDSHLVLFREVLQNPPHGKKLDFVLQEIGRELNTITSKIQSSEIQTLIIEAKGEAERIKEQVQNLE
ncbi:MAG: YicC/YloC family endoribonuclease [Bdellovibrionota bacterium]